MMRIRDDLICVLVAHSTNQDRFQDPKFRRKNLNLIHMKNSKITFLALSFSTHAFTRFRKLSLYLVRLKRRKSIIKGEKSSCENRAYTSENCLLISQSVSNESITMNIIIVLLHETYLSTICL